MNESYFGELKLQVIRKATRNRGRPCDTEAAGPGAAAGLGSWAREGLDRAGSPPAPPPAPGLRRPRPQPSSRAPPPLRPGPRCQPLFPDGPLEAGAQDGGPGTLGRAAAAWPWALARA